MPQRTQPGDVLDNILQDIKDPEERARVKEEYLRQLSPEEKERFKAGVPQAVPQVGAGGPLQIAAGEPTGENILKYGLRIGSAAGAGAAGGGGLLGGTIGGGTQLLADYLFGHGLDSAEPQRAVDPTNVANWSAALTNMLTNRLIPGSGSFSGRLGKELIEQYVPYGAYEAERRREKRKLFEEGQNEPGVDEPSWLSMALPGAFAGAATSGRDILMRRAASNPAWISKTFREAVGTPESGVGALPTQEQAWQQMGRLGERSAAAADLMPQIAAGQKAAAELPPAEALRRLEAAGKAAGMSQEEIDALKTARTQMSTQRAAQIDARQASLIKTQRDMKLLRVERRQLKEELGKLEKPSGEESLTDNAQRTARIATINDRLAKLDDHEPELIKAEAQLQYSLGVKKANTAVAQKELAAVEKTAAASGKMDQKELDEALGNWRQTTANEAKLRDLTQQLHQKTGWRPEDLGPREMEYVQRMAKEHPTKLIDEEIGRALKGENEYNENSVRHFAETMNRILKPEEQGAFRAQVMQRILGDYWSPTDAAFKPMEAKLGKNFEPGGISRLGKAGTNEIFQSPHAWDNLNKLAKQVTEATPKPGSNLYLIRSGVVGTLGLFILSYRFTEAHPVAGAAAVIGTGAVVGGIALGKFVDNVIRQSQRYPEKKIFQMMTNKMFLPAEGTAIGSYARAVRSTQLGPPTDMSEAERERYLNSGATPADVGQQRFSDQAIPQQ